MRQVDALGYNPADVRDILLTHHHRDHIGGLSDFPDARIHALSEAKRAVENLGRIDPDRLAQWDHLPRWAPPPTASGRWRGLRTFTADGVDHRIRLVPLPGRCLGHAGVLVESRPDAWLLHVGDAAFHPNQYSGRPVPPGPAAFAQATQSDPNARAATERVLAGLHTHSDVRIVTAHGPLETAD